MGFGVEVGEAGGGDVVDAIALGEPLFAVMECGEGDVAQLSVGGVDDGFGVGGVEVFFEGSNEGLIEGLSGFGGIGAGIFEGGAKFGDGLVEFFAGDVDGAADGGGVGGDEDEFEAVVENQWIEKDGILLEVAEVVLEGVEFAESAEEVLLVEGDRF